MVIRPDSKVFVVLDSMFSVPGFTPHLEYPTPVFPKPPNRTGKVANLSSGFRSTVWMLTLHCGVFKAHRGSRTAKINTGND